MEAGKRRLAGDTARAVSTGSERKTLLEMLNGWVWNVKRKSNS